MEKGQNFSSLQAKYFLGHFAIPACISGLYDVGMEEGNMTVEWRRVIYDVRRVEGYMT